MNIQTEIDSIVREATYRISKMTHANSLTWDDVHKINDEASKELLQLFDKSVETAKPKKKQKCNHLMVGGYGACTVYTCHEEGGYNDAIKDFEDNWNKIKSREEEI